MEASNLGQHVEWSDDWTFLRMHLNASIGCVYVAMLIFSTAAGEKERLAGERLQGANSRAAALGAALDSLRNECSELRAELDAQAEDLSALRQRCLKLELRNSEVRRSPPNGPARASIAGPAC